MRAVVSATDKVSFAIIIVVAVTLIDPAGCFWRTAYFSHTSVVLGACSCSFLWTVVISSITAVTISTAFFFAQTSLTPAFIPTIVGTGLLPDCK